jgi:Calcineurin-like phosphoesterase
MLICAAGDIHGSIDRFYENVLAFEAALGVRFAHVLHVGDFGVWPDPERIDRATAKHEGPGDFSAWFTQGSATPRPTVFIKGNHEDFEWLAAQNQPDVLPGLRYLRNAQAIDLTGGNESVRVAGLGGCYGASDYARPSKKLEGYAQRHYTRDEIALLGGARDVDILLLHDAPAGVEFVTRARDGRERRYVSEAAGLADAIQRLRPRVCFFGHHHLRVDAEIHGVRCIGLNLIGHPGNLVAVEMDARGRGWSIVGEW